MFAVVLIFDAPPKQLVQPVLSDYFLASSVYLQLLTKDVCIP